MKFNRRKILFVHHVSDIGGASFCLLNIIRALDIDYFEPLVLLRSPGPLSDELNILGVQIVYMSSLWTYPYNKSLLDPRNLSSIISAYNSLEHFEQIINDNKPDIVYFNNSLLFPYLKVTKKNNIASVIHIREHWPITQHRLQLNYIRKQILNNADSIIAINEYSRNMISPDSKKITIVYDWIDMDHRYDNLHIESILNEDMAKLKVFLYAGGDNWIKGPFEVIKAFHEELKNPNYRLLALGVSDKIHVTGVRGKLKSFLHKIGFNFPEYKTMEIIKKDKRVITFPSHYNLSNIINECYCNLSYFRIPHANLTMAECEILGTPSIAALTEESMEYSFNGKLSILFPINDYASFRDKIKNLDHYYDNIKQSLKLNRQYIKAKFDREINAQKLNHTLKSMIR